MELKHVKLFDELSFRLSVMENRRTSWDRVWDVIAKLADPKSATFNVERAPGEFNRGEKKTDSTLALAVPKWANMIDGLLTPKTQKWHGLTVSDRYLADRYRDFFESVCDVMFAVRYSAASNFANANHENLVSIGFYGSGPFSVTEEYGRGIVYKSWPLREFFVEQNNAGEVDVFFRKFTLNTRQALQEFRESSPKDIKECDDLGKEWTFLMAVYPRTDYNPFRLDAKHKPVACTYVCLSTKEIIAESGFDICPFFYPRFDVLPNLQDPYGYSLSMLLLPEIRTLAAMGRGNLRVGNRAADPTYLMSDEDIIGVQRIGQPNAVIPGGLGNDGTPRVVAMQGPNAVPFSLEMLQDIRNTIREGLDLNLLSILVNKPNMTATEALQRASEQSVMFSSTTSRREKEFLGPMVQKEYEILERAGQLPQMPPELQEALASGQAQLQIEYESPIRRAQQADEGTAVMRVLEAAAGLVQFDPSIKNKINTEAALEILQRVWGAPGRIFNSKEQKQAKDLSDAQLAQNQQILQAAPVISQSAKNIAQAQATEGNL